MYFYHFFLIVLSLIYAPNFECKFLIDKCDSNFKNFFMETKDYKENIDYNKEYKKNLKKKIVDNKENLKNYKNILFIDDGNKDTREVHFYLYIIDIYDFDFLSSIYKIKLELIEIWKNVTLNLNNLKNFKNNFIILDDNLINYVDKNYPNLIIEETENYFSKLEKKSLFSDNFEKTITNKNYYYDLKDKKLFKHFKINTQNRCLISYQNYPHINSKCKINFKLKKNLNTKINYKICNFQDFINNKFFINKFIVEIISLKITCEYSSKLEKDIFNFDNCFQLSLNFKNSPRFFYIYFLFSFSLILISFTSLFIPIYYHTTRILIYSLPITLLYLFDLIFFKKDLVFLKESNSFHLWKLGCLCYISLGSLFYILSFYSLARVKYLVEKADLSYLGYLLECTKLVNESKFINNKDHLKSFSEKFYLKTIDEISGKTSVYMPNKIKKQNDTEKFNKFSFENSMEKSLKNLSLKSSKFNSIDFSSSYENSVQKILEKDINSLKKNLSNTKNLKNTNTLSFLNDLLSSSKTKNLKKKKKYISRFIDPNKLKIIEFFSFIPSDKYARFFLPINFFIFFYFYLLHFVF